MTIKVAVCQVPDIRENISASLQWIEKFTRQAEAYNVSLICFPECFLQGYLTEKKLAKKNAFTNEDTGELRILDNPHVLVKTST